MHQPGLLQFITYRLADSLPASVLKGLDEELRSLPREQWDAEQGLGGPGEGDGLTGRISL